MSRLHTLALAATLTALAAPAMAQVKEPIAPFVLDARLVFAGFGEDTVTADDLGKSRKRASVGVVPE